MVADEGFYSDKGRSAERAEAARLAREAREQRDREANARRIREQIEDGTASVGGRKVVEHGSMQPVEDFTPKQCKRCGDPYAALKDGLCPACIRDRKLTTYTDDKMSPEELYPEHFPQD